MPDIQFSSISDFLSMGGYGCYVWTTYAFFTAMVAYNLLQPRLARKKFFKQQAASLQRDLARKDGK